MGPFAEEIAWSTNNIIGVRRFLEKVWRLRDKITADAAKDADLNITVKKVTEDILNFRFNTAVSAMMIQVNAWDKVGSVNKADYETLLKILAPFAPHVADELWENLGYEESIHLAKWPTYDITQITPHTVTVVVQVNSKVRGKLVVVPGLDKEEVKRLALALDGVGKWLPEGKEPEVIYVPDRVINFMV